jgi:hypothetical protein
MLLTDELESAELTNRQGSRRRPTSLRPQGYVGPSSDGAGQRSDCLDLRRRATLPIMHNPAPPWPQRPWPGHGVGRHYRGTRRPGRGPGEHTAVSG